MTCKPSGPTGQVLKGLVGTHQTEKGPSGDFYDELQASRMSKCRFHRTRRMEMGTIGTRHMKKGSSRDFYDELQASRMSNYRSHRYTSDGESAMWRSMTKPFVIDQILFITDR